jgi:porphobilinogen deaminase
MQPVLAALAYQARGLRTVPEVSPPPSMVFAIETLINDPDGLIATITVSQPVSSLEEGAAIGTAVRRVAFEHHLAVDLGLSCHHVRARLARRAGQLGAPDAEE